MPGETPRFAFEMSKNKVQEDFLSLRLKQLLKDMKHSAQTLVIDEPDFESQQQIDDSVDKGKPGINVVKLNKTMEETKGRGSHDSQSGDTLRFSIIDQKINQLKKAISERDLKIAALENAVREKNMNESQLRRLLKEKNSLITTLHSASKPKNDPPNIPDSSDYVESRSDDESLLTMGGPDMSGFVVDSEVNRT